MLLQKSREEYIDGIIMLCIFTCIILTGLLPQKMLSIGVLFCICLLSTRDKLFLAYPIMIFYYAQLGLVFGISVYRIYTILFIVLTVIKFSEKMLFSKRFIAPLIIYVLYELLAMSQYSAKTAFFSFLDVLCIIFLINFYLNDGEKIKAFFSVYVKVSLLAFLTGIVINNSSATDWNFSGTFVEINRFQATFDDPNYMGFFYTIAIFAIVCLGLYSKRMQKILITVLSGMILTTLSMTAIIGNIVLWAVYLVVSKKIKPKTFIYIVIIFVVAIVLYNYSLSNREIPVLGDLSYRIESKVDALSTDDYASVTTNRSELSKSHLEYFMNQGIFRQLFGGNLTNTYVIQLGKIKGIAHNEYVDSLLNIGIVGSVVMFGNILLRLFKARRVYKNDKSEEYLFIFMSKCILLYYLTTLTIFLDFRFMFALFI